MASDEGAATSTKASGVTGKRTSCTFATILSVEKNLELFKVAPSPIINDHPVVPIVS